MILDHNMQECFNNAVMRSSIASQDLEEQNHVCTTYSIESYLIKKEVSKVTYKLHKIQTSIDTIP